MALLYDRTEENGVVEIVFRRQLLAYGVLLVVYTLTLFIFRLPLVALAIIVFGLVVMVRDRRAISRELRAAAAEDRLTVTGSQWSRRNPLTYQIGPPGAVRKGKQRPKKGTQRTKKRGR